MSLNSNLLTDRHNSPAWRVKTKITLAVLIVILGLVSRFFPHAWNFTPITAIAIFISAYFGVRYSLVTVLAILFISDAFLGFYQWQVMIAVYGSFILASLLGCLAKEKKSPGLIFVSAVSSSLVFFLVTNWAVWQFGTMYEHSFGGLLQSYVMALPFFRNSLAGDLFYTGAFFGGFEMAWRAVLNRQTLGAYMRRKFLIS